MAITLFPAVPRRALFLLRLVTAISAQTIAAGAGCSSSATGPPPGQGGPRQATAADLPPARPDAATAGTPTPDVRVGAPAPAE
jgi:hypothetical protein